MQLTGGGVKFPAPGNNVAGLIDWLRRRTILQFVARRSRIVYWSCRDVWI